jgi:hypothetical protein
LLSVAALNPKRALRTQSKNWRKSVFVIKTVQKGDGIVRDDSNDDDDDDDKNDEPCSVVYSESNPGEIEVPFLLALAFHVVASTDSSLSLSLCSRPLSRG